MSALTSILKIEDYQNYPKGLVKAYEPFDIRVGKSQDIIGHPYLRNANIQPVDVLYKKAQISDTPHLGESSSLSNLSRSTNISDIQPQEPIIFRDQEGGEYVEVQKGEGFLKSLKKGIKKAKKIGKAVKKTAGVVKSVAKVGEKLGIPGAKTVRVVSGKSQKTLKQLGLGEDGTEYYQDQDGKGIFKKIAKGIKKAKKIGKAIKKTAGVVKSVAKVGEKLGIPGAKTVRVVSGKTQKGLKQAGLGQTPQAVGRAGNIIAMQGQGLQEELEEIKKQPRSIRSFDSMTFSAIHPLNYPKAINRLP
jgi:hypothetical protein